MAKLVTWGQTFEESRTRMLSALNDFYIQGVETSIPLYKTILNSDEYKNGELSTDFLKRYDMIDRLTVNLKKEKEYKSEAALAAAIIYSEYFKSRVQSNTTNNSHWKNKLD
jgi:acetyl-CoA/propionyl-CoA carboxylase